MKNKTTKMFFGFWNVSLKFKLLKRTHNANGDLNYHLVTTHWKATIAIWIKTKTSPCNYIFSIFWVKRCVYSQKVWCQDVIKDCKNSCLRTEKRFKDIILMFRIQVFHWQHWFHNLSEKTYRQELLHTRSLQSAARMANWTESKH